MDAGVRTTQETKSRKSEATDTPDFRFRDLYIEFNFYEISAGTAVFR